MSTLKGGCLCRAVRYEVHGEPDLVALCGCRHCRKQSGSFRALNWIVPLDRLVIEGELASYRDVGDSGQTVERQFCPRCGSPIRTLAKVLPGKAVLKAGTLDETPSHAPSMVTYADNSAAWESLPTTCQEYSRARPR